MSIWKKIKDYADTKLAEEYLNRCGCNSCCPRCRQWEHQGNAIKTEPFDEYDLRSCSICGYSWKAIFTPAGFIPLEEMK